MICTNCGPMADGADDHLPDCPEAQRRRSGDGDGPRVVREMLETLRGFGQSWEARVAREKAEHQALAADPWVQLERAGVPLDARDSLRRYEPTPASRAAEAFFRGDKRTLLLIGPPGVGKSVAAARVVQLHLAACGRAAWVPAESFISMSAYDGEPERLKRAELLVVDDLGREGRGFGRSLLSGVLRRRYEMHRRSVITTNADQGQLLQLYDTGMWDRLRGGDVVTCSGRSLRGG